MFKISDNQIIAISIDSAANVTLGVDLFLENLSDYDSDLANAIDFDSLGGESSVEEENYENN